MNELPPISPSSRHPPEKPEMRPTTANGGQPLPARVLRVWLLIINFVVLVVLVFELLGWRGYFSIPIIIANLPAGVEPAFTSLVLTNIAFCIGFLFAVPLALVRAYGPAMIRWHPASRASTTHARDRPARWLRRLLVTPAYALASGYVHAVRGTPFLVQVFLVYYVVIFAYPRLVFLGADTAFWAGLIALAINTIGYQAEVLRGGFQSVDRSQIEAARAIGLSSVQIFTSITLPQSLRIVTLQLTNEWISLFKASAILSYITVVELYFWARTDIAYGLGRPIEAFVLLTIFYLAINVTLSRVVTYVERRRRIPGLGAADPEGVTVRPSALGR